MSWPSGSYTLMTTAFSFYRTGMLCFRFVIPIDHQLTCGQSVFSIAVTIAYFILIFWMFANRNRMSLTESLHMVTKTIYRDLPCLRIALVVRYEFRRIILINPFLRSHTDLRVPVNLHCTQCAIHGGCSVCLAKEHGTGELSVDHDVHSLFYGVGGMAIPYFYQL